MDARLANTWRLTVNEKKFIESALLSGIRVDGRNPYEFRKLSIKFGREDGSSEVQLGHTHVMGFVTGQLVQPYRDRPNEGSLSIFTEFSPMADPSFESGRPGESAVELGRIIDRGLRNLVDAANIAALASLLTFRRPECSLGGENGQEVIIHPPEEREPLPLIVHHLPVAVTFGFFGSESILVIDPTHHEEAVMTGRMTATLNANGDVCAIQKPGGEGVLQSAIMQCLRIASRTASDITKKIKDTVEAYNTERALRKIKRQPTSIALDGSANVKVEQEGFVGNKGANELPKKHMGSSRLVSEESTSQSNDCDGGTKSSGLGGNSRRNDGTTNFVGEPASWDPYSKGVDPDFLKASLASRGTLTPKKKQQDLTGEKKPSEVRPEEPPEDINTASSAIDASGTGLRKDGEKTLKDAVKPKHKRKKRASSAADAS